MKVFNIIIFFSLILSCSSPEKSPQNPESSQEKTRESSLLNCYRYESESDTITLKLIHVGKSITGTLVYKLKEKDKNMGTILGSMREDILVADYTFVSEGIQSKRQVAFKLDGNTFIEGFGEVIDENEKTRFKNLDSLIFNSSIRLAAFPCQ